MPSVALALRVVALRLFVNGLFAFAEIARVPSQKSRLKTLAEKAPPRAPRALASGEATKSLSTVQFGVALSGIAADTRYGAPAFPAG